MSVPITLACGNRVASWQAWTPNTQAGLTTVVSAPRSASSRTMMSYSAANPNAAMNAKSHTSFRIIQRTVRSYIQPGKSGRQRLHGEERRCFRPCRSTPKRRHQLARPLRIVRYYGNAKWCVWLRSGQLRRAVEEASGRNRPPLRLAMRPKSAKDAAALQHDPNRPEDVRSIGPGVGVGVTVTRTWLDRRNSLKRFGGEF